jgi:hypothetical protein
VSVSLSEWGKPKFARMKILNSIDGNAVKAFPKEHVKLNRRYLAHDIFSHLANACALAPPKPYYALIG